MYEQDFPWWYGTVKWVIPLLLAFSSATWFALCITGVIAWPSAFAALSWTPGMFKVIDSLYAIGLVSTGMIAIGSVVGFCSALTLRGLFLLPVLENIVFGAKHNAFESKKEAEINKKNYDDHMLCLVQEVEEEQLRREEAESRCKELEVRLEILEGEGKPFITSARKKLFYGKKSANQDENDEPAPEPTVAGKSRSRKRKH